MAKKQTMTLERITPEIAKRYLERNVNNRPASEANCELMTEEFRFNYHLNGEPIKFDDEGNLADGQTRLTAIIRSGRTVDIWVCRNLDSDAVDILDRGRRRSNAHVLARRHEENYNMLAAAVRCVFHLLQGGIPNSFAKSCRIDQMDQILDKYGKELRAACQFVNRYKNNKLLPPSELAFLVAWGNIIYGDGVAEPFWKQVCTAEELRRGTPQFALFHCLNKRDDDKQLKRTARLAFCVKAFNSYLSGRDMKAIRHAEGDEFPAFLDPIKISSTRLAQLKNGHAKA